MNKPNAGAKPHVHAEVIKAWADGAEIEFRPNMAYFWVECSIPTWEDSYEYRVKPKVTHKIGNRYSFEGSEYILAQCAPYKVVLIAIKGLGVGNRWSGSIRVESEYKISQEEFDDICTHEKGFELITEVND